MPATGLIGRLAGAASTLLLLSLLLLWMIRQIPGSYDDFLRAEETTEEAGPALQKRATVELFYFSLIPSFSESQKNDPSGISLAEQLPSFSWNGANNAFHKWLFETSFSLRDRMPVHEKILDAVSWTLMVQLPSVAFIFLLGFVLAEWSLRTRYRRLSDWLTNGLTVLHSMPPFWLAGLLLLLFAGGLFSWLPSSFVSSDADNAFEFWIFRPQYLILPVLCMVLPSLSAIYRLVRRQMMSRMEEPFWKRVLASGISKETGFARELRPLALIPLAAWIASAVPLLISGSLIIENVFSIPGTGRLLYQSVAYRDWPVVHALVVLAAAMTMLGIGMADMLQAWLDPRIGKPVRPE